jgi:type VI secretion system protein ImpL
VTEWRRRAGVAWRSWSARRGRRVRGGRSAGWWRVPLRAAAALFLGTWLAGLVLAAVQLNRWDDELVRTLLQIRADAVFRERMTEGGEPIPREWYRSKTLALLEASEKLQDDAHWALFVPGSWRAFDNLRQRVAVRIERAFSDIAVETVRRELYYKTSQLTGVPQDRYTAEPLATGDCATPPLAVRLDGSGSAASPAQELPEFAAVHEQLAAIEELDEAVQAMLALQRPDDNGGENLRLLARYALGVELPGQLSRSAAFFRTGLKPEDVTFTVRAVPRMQRAVRCSLGKAMYALDTRLFERNDLLATEAFLAQRVSRLFAPRATPGAFAETVEAYHDVIAAIDEQETLLDRAEYAWLHQRGSGNGPHDSLLARINRIGLLGPEAVEQLRRQSGGAFERFRRQFGVMVGAGSDPALVWNEEQGRLMLSAQRIALREGLADLLQEPFMVEPAGRDFPPRGSGPLSWNTDRLEQALELAQARQRFATDKVPAFPPGVRQSVAQFVDAHLAQLVQDTAVEAISHGGANAGLADFPGYRSQREQLSRVQALLVDLRARDRAYRLRALLAHDLLDRLALAESAMWRSPIYSDRTQHFGWWQGEGSPVLQAFGVADRLMLRHSLSQQLKQVDDVGRAAAAYLAYVDSSIASSPTVLRWRGIVDELKRYRAGAADSSLLALEHYLLFVGADLHRSNCLERLSFAAPRGGRADEFARRHVQIHEALLSRCVELRSPAVHIEPPRPAAPFG